jgi:UDP-N-acetyl-2-amino-2-deoxyglucuronate dehydrogenase
MSADIRVALVGCGRISQTHFEAIREVDGVEARRGLRHRRAAGARSRATERCAVVHVVSRRCSRTWRATRVAICTPSGLHPSTASSRARAGKHVICEKPMAITLAAADELVHVCDESNVHLFVVKQNRLNPSVQLVKRAVDKGRFGRLYLANTTVRWTRPQEYYDQAPWRGTWEFDGGAFMNQASHYVDLIQWLVGPVESVIAKTATLARRIETEDTGIAVLKFRSGALGVIEVTMLTYPKNLEGSLTLLGEKGTVRIGGTR